MPDRVSRRALLVTGAVSALSAGCLRLSNDQDTSTASTPAAGTPPEPGTPPDSGSTPPSQVSLSTIKQFDRFSEVFTYGGHYYLFGHAGEAVARITPAGEVVWRTSVDASRNYYPSGASAHGQQTVFFGQSASDDAATSAGKVLAFDDESGEQRWAFDAATDGKHHRIPSLASVSSDLVVAGSNSDGSGDEQRPHVYGLDPASGTERWRTTDLPRAFISTVFAYRGVPYVLTLRGLFKCDPTTGEPTEVWSFFSGFGMPAVVDGTLYAPANELMALDLQSETKLWETETTDSIKSQPAVDGDAVFAGGDAGFIYRLDATSGEIVWESRAATEINRVQTTAGLVWAIDENATIYAFQTDDGTEVYRDELDEKGHGTVAALDGTLFAIRDEAVLSTIVTE